MKGRVLNGREGKGWNKRKEEGSDGKKGEGRESVFVGPFFVRALASEPIHFLF